MIVAKIEFRNDTTKLFFHLDEYLQSSLQKADLALLLDVISHLVGKTLFHASMQNLFSSSQKFVIIYSLNKNECYIQHVKHREFSDWIRG